MSQRRVGLTRAVAWAAAIDAGTRAMRAEGRIAWNRKDAWVALREFERLWPAVWDIHQTKEPHA